MASRSGKHGVKKLSNTANQRHGNDAPYYESPGGVIFGAAGFGAEAGVGVPEAPALRGAPHHVGSEPIPNGGTPGKSGVLNSFFQKGRD